jgi:hypothetical protein
MEQGQKDISTIDNGSNGGSWKIKCRELYEICKGLAEDNTNMLSIIRN